MNKSSSLNEPFENITEENNNIMDKSNNIDDSPSKKIEEKQNKPKLITKKRELKKTIKKIEDNSSNIINNEEIIINNNENILINPFNNIPSKNKNSSEKLIESIIINYLVSKWRNNVFIKKYEVRGYNQKRALLKKGLSTLGKVFDIKKLIYLYEMFDVMTNMPQKPGVVHDPFYGKIKIINKRFKNDNCEANKINNNNSIKINEKENNKINKKNMSDKKNQINQINESNKKKENKSPINNNIKRNKSTNSIKNNKVTLHNNKLNTKINNSEKKVISQNKFSKPKKLNININKSNSNKNYILNKDRNMYKSNNYFYPANIKSLNYNIYHNNIVDKGKKGNKLNINFSYINGKNTSNSKKYVITDKKNSKSHINRSADNNLRKNKKTQMPNILASSNNFYYNNSYAQKYLKKKMYERNNNNRFINSRLFNYNYKKDQKRINSNNNIFY